MAPGDFDALVDWAALRRRAMHRFGAKRYTMSFLRFFLIDWDWLEGLGNVKMYHLRILTLYRLDSVATACGVRVAATVASPRGGGGASGVPCPPTSDRTPREIDADPRRFSCAKKMGVGLQVLLRRFTCTDATADVFWSYDYEKEGVVEVVQ